LPGEQAEHHGDCTRLSGELKLQQVVVIVDKYVRQRGAL